MAEYIIVNAKIKTQSHAPVFHMQSYWWVWFPGIEPQILEPTTISAEGSGAKERKFAPAKISRYTIYRSKTNSTCYL